jgi:hypothetical protein
MSLGLYRFRGEDIVELRIIDFNASAFRLPAALVRDGDHTGMIGIMSFAVANVPSVAQHI